MAEATTEPETLARTLVNLGIDSNFLKNGELQQLPRDARGRIVDEIVDQRLSSGRWQGVVEMIFGGLGKADVLYGGSPEDLRRRIVDSVGVSPDQTIDPKVFETLEERGERELLYGIAMAAGSEFSFNNAERIVSPLFQDPEKGEERKREFHTRAANSYLKGRNYRSALDHFAEIEDSDGVADVFERGFVELAGGSLTEEMKRPVLDAALYSPEHKDERLKRIILTSLQEEGGITSQRAFDLFREHEVLLTDEERTALYDSAAENFSDYDLTEWKGEGWERDRRKVEIDPELSLLWAKKHTETDPIESYHIFRRQNYEGPETLTAARSGLEKVLEEPSYREVPHLSPGDVSPEHLRAVYSEVPIGLRKNIAIILRDQEGFNYKESLQQLSRDAEAEGNLELAYECWSLGSGDEKRLKGIRARLIKRDIANENEGRFPGKPNLFFLDSSLDRPGYIHAIDALIKASPSSKAPFGFLERAHEFSIVYGAGEQIDTIRRKLVEMDSKAALRVFMGSSYLYRRREEGEETEMTDPKGFDYALGVIAQEQGTSVEDLRPLIEKYACYMN